MESVVCIDLPELGGNSFLPGSVSILKVKSECFFYPTRHLDPKIVLMAIWFDRCFESACKITRGITGAVLDTPFKFRLSSEMLPVCIVYDGYGVLVGKDVHVDP